MSGGSISETGDERCSSPQGDTEKKGTRGRGKGKRKAQVERCESSGLRET
jgi:hypothetical protein